jgi:transcriptional regulator GlxA family with amidase domain
MVLEARGPIRARDSMHDALYVVLADVRTNMVIPLHARSRHVVSLLQIIHADPFEPGLSAKVLKSRCGISDHNVASLFKFEIGASIMDYVIDLRVHAAEICLLSTNASVAAIALAVGFSNLQGFYEAFKARNALPPGKYRRSGAIAKKTDYPKHRLRDEDAV